METYQTYKNSRKKLKMFSVFMFSVDVYSYGKK